MRLFFKKGRQRQLVEEFKNSHPGESWREISNRLRTKPNALKEWRYETASLPSEIYSRLDKEGRYSRWIEEKKPDFWGRSLGGVNTAGRRKKISLPKPSPLLAEFFGIILGDGNVYVNKKHGVYQIRVASHLIHEKEYAMFVSALFIRLFDLKAPVYRRGRALYANADSKELAFYLLENLPGLKKKFVFPEWLFKDKECLRSFVRGLTDTDGSIYRLSNKNPDTLRIGFKNADKSISMAYRKALLELGFHPSKLIYRNIFLTRKTDLERYLKEIGFNNTKHRNRLLKIAPSYSGQILGWENPNRETKYIGL